MPTDLMSRLLKVAMLGLILSETTALFAQTLREETGLFDRVDGTQSASKLNAGTPVKPLKRQGFWLEVDAGSKSGWLKVSAVNFSSGASGPTAIDTGRLGTGNIVATSVARGLSAKDLLEGKPNFVEAGKLDLLGADAAAVDALRLQGETKLVVLTIALAAPAPTPAPPAAPPSATGTQPVAAAAGAAATATGKKKDGDDW